MREVEGFIFVADWHENGKSLFGKHSNPENRENEKSYEIFPDNNFLTFDTDYEVRRACQDYLSWVLREEQEYQPINYKRVGAITPAQINMQIAERPEDIDSLSDRNLIVMVQEHGSKDIPLLGPPVQGRESHALFQGLADEINKNDFTTFHYKDKASKVIEELSFYPSLSLTLAKFDLQLRP